MCGNREAESGRDLQLIQSGLLFISCARCCLQTRREKGFSFSLDSYWTLLLHLRSLSLPLSLYQNTHLLTPAHTHTQPTLCFSVTLIHHVEHLFTYTDTVHAYFTLPAEKKRNLPLPLHSLLDFIHWYRSDTLSVICMSTSPARYTSLTSATAYCFMKVFFSFFEFSRYPNQDHSWTSVSDAWSDEPSNP